MKKFIVNRKEFDQYQDMVSRLYPELTSQAKELHKNSMSTMEITFQVTNACSLACSYCYQINKGIKVMSFDTAKRFIDNLFNKCCTSGSNQCTPFVQTEIIECSAQGCINSIALS